VTGGPLWAEFDREHGGGVAGTERELRENAKKVRDRLIGIGCKGELVELAGCRPR
jgi:hypothetical protein